MGFRLFIAPLLVMSLIPAPSAAASLADCGLEYVLPPPSSSKDPVVLTFRGLVDYCSSIRVAAAGEHDVLGLPAGPIGTTEHFNVILAVRPAKLGPGVSCPAVEVPFEIGARLPDLIPAVPVPGIDFIGVFLRYEDEDGKLISLTDCGEVGWGGTEEGYRKEIYFRNGFYAQATWRTATDSGDAFAVPADTVWTDSGLFWFFDPKNTEVMVKVLDGCAVNDHFWVLGSASTNVGFTLKLTNSATGDTWEVSNPGGKLAPAFADVNAFPCRGD